MTDSPSEAEGAGEETARRVAKECRKDEERHRFVSLSGGYSSSPGNGGGEDASEGTPSYLHSRQEPSNNFYLDRVS
jgi:hypothetical protein